MHQSRSGSKGVSRPVREAQILDAAAIEFGRRGYAATTVAVVAERARISKPLIYGYFSTKEGLYCACVDRAGKHLTDRIAAALAHPDQTPTERAIEVLGAIFTALEPRPQDWKILFDTSAPVSGRATTTVQHYHDLLSRQAADGITASFSSALHEPRDLSALIVVWMNVVTALVNWWLMNPDQTAQDMVDRSQRIIAVLG